MKKFLTVLLALTLLAGCGGKPKEVNSATTPAVSSKAADKGDTKLITEDVVKYCLADKSFKCKDKTTLDGEIREHDDKKFTVKEITELNYTTEINNNDKNLVDVSGTFQALGTHSWKNRRVSTAEPVEFSFSVFKDSEAHPQDFRVKNIPLVKPPEAIDYDNLWKYINKNSYDDLQYKVTDGQPFLDVVKDSENPSPNLRLAIIENPFADDDELMDREFIVDVYDGDEYLCTGEFSMNWIEGSPEVHLFNLEKLR